jgi:glycosyltransferase involved in cell wall biosynthesis
VERKINIHIYPSQLTNESRIEKEVKSLIDLQLVDKVIVLGINNGSLPKEVNFYQGVKFIRLDTIFSSSDSRVLRYILFFEYSIRAFFFIFNSKANIINCHSLHVLPIGALLKIFKKFNLIYDTHELETEVSGSKGFIRVISKALEKLCIKYVDYTIVVSNSIEEWYKNTYKICKIKTIRNIPNHKHQDISQTNFIRQKFNISNLAIVFIYQGLLSSTRGVNIIVEAFKILPKDKFHIVFLGFGPMQFEIENIANQNENIHFISKVSPTELPEFTRSADIGIHMILNSCLNHYYCLPNKLFEYFINGLPVIVSDFPEMKELVDQNNIGWLIEPSSENLISTINNITSEEVNLKKQNVASSKGKYSWENEEVNYIDIYNF